MSRKSVKTAKLYIASVMLCIPYIFTEMGQNSNLQAKFRKFHKEFKKVFAETFVQNSMPSKSVKTAKLYIASVWLCTPYATPKVFKLGNSELWRPVIPDPEVGSRSAKKRFEILSMSTTYPKLIALRFVLTPRFAWKKANRVDNLHLALRPFGTPIGPSEI